MALNPAAEKLAQYGATDLDGRIIVVGPDGVPIAGGGGGGGVQYTEGVSAPDATPTGNVIIWKDVGDALVAVSAAKPLPVEVTSMPAGGSGLTDAELRATPVDVAIPGDVALDAPTLAALETITAAVSSLPDVTLDAATLAALENIVVTGTVALDAPTLAALETINAVVTGTVALDGATLTALENITVAVSGAVALDAGTLAALETIELGATTLAALESITATISGTVATDPTDEPTRELGRVGAALITPATGTINLANPNSVAIPVAPASGVGIQFSGTYAAWTFIPQQSLDGGTTWVNSTCSDSSLQTAVEQAGAGLTANQTVSYSMTLLPGCTHIRIINFGGAPATGDCNYRITGSSITRPNAQAVRIDQTGAASSRIRIFDGTDEATVLPNRTLPATTEKALVMTELPMRMPTYQVVTAEVAPAITIGVKELLCFWHPAAVTVDVHILEIVVSVLVTTASTTGGRTNVEVLKVTSAPTGGANTTPADIGGGLGTSAVETNSAANIMQVKTGGGALGRALIRQGIHHATAPLGSQRHTIFNANANGEGIILRGGSADGINIQVNRVVAHTALVDQWTAAIRWIEL